MDGQPGRSVPKRPVRCDARSDSSASGGASGARAAASAAEIAAVASARDMVSGTQGGREKRTDKQKKVRARAHVSRLFDEVSQQILA
jgi:hypothetical protein